MASEQKLRDLTNISKKALTDYDELLAKYNQLLTEHEETKQELSQLQEAAIPMYDEFGHLQTQFEVERSMRTAAETYASAVLKDNKKIKRQSAMLMAQMSAAPVAINIDIDDSSAVEDGRVEELNKTVAKLQEEITTYRTELEDAREEISMQASETDTIMAEREEYKMKCAELQEQLTTVSAAVKAHQKQLKSFHRASALNIGDYSSLEDKFNTEKALRLKAESYANELQRKYEAVAATSDMDGDEPSSALHSETERLHKELSEQEIKYKLQVEELEEQLKLSSSHEAIVTLEEKVEVIKEELERLSENYEAEKKTNAELKQTIDKLERERNAQFAIPLPPPPPPPPGPAAGIGRLILGKKKKRQKTLEKVVGKPAIKDDVMKSAIDEMMARIKSGTHTLRRVDPADKGQENQDPKEESKEPMNEMDKYMKSLRKQKRPERTCDQPKEESELSRMLAARRERSNSIDTPKANSDSSEIRRSGSFDSHLQNPSVGSVKTIIKQASQNTPVVAKPRAAPRVAPKPSKSGKTASPPTPMVTTNGIADLGKDGNESQDKLN